MSGADEEWVKAAMSDDTIVVDLLVSLHRTPPPSHPPPPPPRHLPLEPVAFPLQWKVRQRRSKSIPINNHPKKPAHRASPTTPLSWSGATSISGASGGATVTGFEESSPLPPLKPSDVTRSKVTGECEKSTSKKSRKKKTLPELKQEENLLIKERRELKRELTALRLNLEKQRATNESLKRMKLEVQPHSNKGTAYTTEESVSDQVQQKMITGHHIPSIASPVISSKIIMPSQSLKQNGDAASDSKFELPDLNIPFDDPSSEVICGVS